MKAVPRIVLLSLFLPLAAFALPPEAIVQKADEIRNPGDSYLMQVRVESPDQSDGPASFEVRIQGNDRTLVRTLEPARDRGRSMLMLEEEMWAYIPNLHRAVRVSLSQKLTGQAANGDISRMRWTGDYDAKLESETPKAWVIFLKAKKKGLTYDQLRVWIEKGSFHPTAAEFLSLSGKVLKRATYSSYRPIAGKVRPTRILIEDATRAGDKSTIAIEKMEVKKFPASIFQQSNLSRSE